LLLSETNGGAGWSLSSVRFFSVQAAEGWPCAALLALSRALFGRCSLSLIQLYVRVLTRVCVCVFSLYLYFSFSLFFVVSDGASPAGSECIAAVGGGTSSSVTAPNESKRPGIVVDRLSDTENDDKRGPPDHGGPP
jgi:hypothetical protein